MNQCMVSSPSVCRRDKDQKQTNEQTKNNQEEQGIRLQNKGKQITPAKQKTS